MPPYLTGKDIILHLIGRLGIDGASYRVLEFTGDAVPALSMADRFTVCNRRWRRGPRPRFSRRIRAPWIIWRPARSAPIRCMLRRGRALRRYGLHRRLGTGSAGCLSAQSRQRAAAARGDKRRKNPRRSGGSGSCTNGRLEDLRCAAGLLRGKKVHPRTRMIVIPGSQEVVLRAMEEGLLKIFVEAGAAVCTPSCGPCIGGHMGVLAAGETCVATNEPQFQGAHGGYEQRAVPDRRAGGGRLGRARLYRFSERGLRGGFRGGFK